jgi:hypothetical protein
MSNGVAQHHYLFSKPKPQYIEYSVDRYPPVAYLGFAQADHIAKWRRSGERENELKMKTATAVPKATEPTKLIQIVPPEITEGKPTRAWQGLSPQRIEDGASTKTEILAEILDRAEKSSHLRHWGINE